MPPKYCSPGRHICGKGDTVGYEGQWCGAGDVLPLRRGHPSCKRQGPKDELELYNFDIKQACVCILGGFEGPFTCATN